MLSSSCAPLSTFVLVSRLVLGCIGTRSSVSISIRLGLSSSISACMNTIKIMMMRCPYPMVLRVWV